MTTQAEVPRDLADRVALVLGAGSIGSGWGIGKACAARFAQAGATVVAADVDLAAAERAVQEIASLGVRAEALGVDVLDDDAVADAVATVVSRCGRLDVLHCNVGLGKAGDGAATTPDEWRRFSDANLTSVHVATQAALPQMRRQGSGVLLATSSIAGLRYPGYQHLAYGATKAGLNHLMRLLAVENGPHGVRSNTIVAGLIDTPRIEKTLAGRYGPGGLEEMRAARAGQVPLGRMGSAWDVANVALFLASDRAAYVTGTEILVDGGLSGTVRQPL